MLEKHCVKCFNILNVLTENGCLGAEHNPLAADDVLRSSEDCCLYTLDSCLVAEESSLDVAIRALLVLMQDEYNFSIIIKFTQIMQI